MTKIPPNSPIRVAMIGGGVNSAIGRVHEIAMKMDGHFQLVAGCFSRNREINRESGERYGLSPSRVHTSINDLLDKESGKVDAVVIATPIQAHFEHINQALDRNFRVISDKPLVGSAENCSALKSRIEQESKEVYCIFNYTGYPAVREIRHRVRSGSLGRVFKVMAEMPQDSYQRLVNQGRQSTIQEWRLRDDSIACVTLDLFVHIHSLVNFICEGRPEEVTAWARSITAVSPGLIDEVDAIIRYDSGMIVNAWYGKAALGYRNGLRIRIFGTEGSLQWHQEDPETLIGANAQGDRTLLDRISTSSEVTVEARYQRFKAGHPAGFIEAFANYYSDIAETIRSNKPSPYIHSIDAVHEGLKLAAAIHQSSHPTASRVFRLT